ncbi:Pyruvate formate-lyase (EC [Olavius algarvensis associated proteobacterium Delta 3]|nr:Pyruvate formate-lyase (EC [Olavius algarvensis associated proteobacterium Delta 3]CAB5170091.1 Pyruvate formate-lyase (EC [Olavius algarvensis associated proteobacterium Delta 3]
MNDRIQRLRTQSLMARPTISSERAELVTQFYQTGIAQKESVPVQRALAFKHVLENKSIGIDDDELIVGERGPEPKATPTYPEICLHSLEDLDLMDRREKVPFAVADHTKAIYESEIIPFWKGKTNRERIFSHLPSEWKDAYESGVFTEFQEQRSPGHTVLGDRIYREGVRDMQRRIRSAIENLDFYNDPDALNKKEELTAMDIVAEALMTFAQRHAEKLTALAGQTEDPFRNAELLEMAAICRRVPENAPTSFWEALQYYWFVHIGVITELNPWDSFNPGRLDQHLYPFYQREIDEGTLTKERAKELLCAFWIKFNNHPAPPKTGVTLKESSTYVDFALINLGGVSRDNIDGVNELTYLMLDVIEEMRLLQPSSMVQLSKKNPDRFIRRALKIVRTGFGQPSIFNTDAIVQELVRQGKSVEDARQGGASGCVEAGAFGREAYILTGYFNLPKILEITLFNGRDPRTGKQLGPETGEPSEFEDFDQLFDAFKTQLAHFIDIKIKGNNIIEQLNARYMPVPFLSLLIDDCIENGMDYNAGGARYNTSYIQGVGLGSVTDAMSALKYQIFDQKRVSMNDLIEALRADFKGYEALHRSLLDETPKYGNDDDYADGILKQVFEAYYGAINGRPNTRGGAHRINLLPTTCHIYFGSVIGALPDGRRAGKPLSEGISPVQGADRNGPTAVTKSAAKIDHIRTGGTLLNQKFLPQVLDDDGGIAKLAHLVRSYFKMDGHHIQFNVVGRDELLRAQKHPDEYRDLIVRVAGYSDYFVDLTRELQDEIIDRTEHENL